MIGRLKLPHHVSAFDAVIVNGAWQSGDTEFQSFLEARFPLTDISPADGQPGAKQLRDAAEALGGRVEWAEQPAVEPGVVY
jgi:hypothetical protein